MENSQNENKGDFKRLTAIKLSLNDLLSYEYVKDEGWNPNYLIGPNNKRISRVNIIGFITSQEDNSIILDDSTANITVRTFENLTIFDNKNVGDLVIVIGKPREFGNERYIVPDIIRKIEDRTWLKVRHKELNINYLDFNVEHKKPKDPIMISVSKEDNQEDNDSSQEKTIPEAETSDNVQKSTYDIIIDLINKKDSGDGASIDELISESNIDNCEKILNTLLEEGEIFEIKPGIVKVL